MAEPSAGKFVAFVGFRVDLGEFKRSLDCPCEVVCIEGKSRCQIKPMYACNFLISRICHCRDEAVCLKKPPRDYRRDTWLTLVLTSAICVLSCEIWQVYMPLKVHSMHYTFIIFPRYFLWEMLANSSTLCAVISRLAALQTLTLIYHFIWPAVSPSQESWALELCLDKQIICGLIYCFRGQKKQLLFDRFY